MRFALALHARSGRWIPPALLLATWVVLVVANPGSALDNAANLFFAVLIVSVWCTSAIGNVDDDPHRDLCAASVGGPARLMVSRHAAALVMMTVTVGVVAALGIVSGARTAASGPTVVAGTVGLLASGALLGVAIGGFLHRPILRSTAWVVVIALVAIMVVVLLPPVRDVLRDADHSRIGGVGVLLLASLGVVAVATWAAAALAARAS
jgi:hypothetical protein